MGPTDARRARAARGQTSGSRQGTPVVAAGPRLGELLTGSGAVSPGALAAALMAQRRSGGRLGEILLAAGAVGEEDLHRALARRWGLPFLGDDARAEPNAVAPGLAWDLGLVPVRGHDGGPTVFACSELPHALQLERLAEATGAPPRLVVTTPRRERELLAAAYADDALDSATHDLRRRRPAWSAHVVWTRAQRHVALGLALAVAAGVALAPLTTATVLLVASLAYYGLHSVYRFKLALDSMGGAGTVPVSHDELTALDERSLPTYTILVPLFHEAGVVATLMRNLSRLDYPQSKLEVLLLCEADDDETIAALLEAGLAPNHHLVRVPPGLPRTKPKACNYGLLLARGQLCVIYDAEDRPDPDQLKKAVVALRKSGESLACVQAKLNYFNRRQNLLTRWFAAEYAVWFDLVLPGLYANGHPIPLGGTSNHFRTAVLRDLGAWDPFNVTEDADLGIRLWKAGYATAVIDSITLEEANSQVGNWVRQRSRWIKGYLQTWLVHMRRPVALLRAGGIGPFLSLQFTVGGILVTLANPLLWSLAVVFLVVDPPWLEQLFPGPLFALALAQLLLGNFLHAYLFVIGLARRGFWDVIPAILLLPAYWVLMSVAGWKGAIQLVTRPFYWEKTRHGLADPDAYLEAAR